MRRCKHLMHPLTTRLLAGGAVLVLCCAATALQEAGSSTDDSNLLAGPKVSDGASDADNDTMTATREQNDNRRLKRASIPPRMWIREVRQFALTDEQRASLETTVSEYETQQRQHIERHGPELRELAKQLRQKRNGNLEMTAELRERMKAIRAEAPVFEEYQRRIWEVLMPEQRDELTARLEVLQTQMDEERASRRLNGRRQRDRQNVRAAEGPVSAGVNSPSLDAFDELGRRRLRFLIRHKKRGTEGDLEINPPRRLPPPPPPGPPPADE